MAEPRFDDLSRVLARPIPRRQALRLAAAALAGGALAALRPATAHAAVCTPGELQGGATTCPPFGGNFARCCPPGSSCCAGGGPQGPQCCGTGTNLGNPYCCSGVCCATPCCGGRACCQAGQDCCGGRCCSRDATQPNRTRCNQVSGICCQGSTFPCDQAIAGHRGCAPDGFCSSSAPPQAGGGAGGVPTGAPQGGGGGFPTGPPQV
jgi:hypothetical protein